MDSKWTVEYTDEFGYWWDTLDVAALLLLGGNKSSDDSWYLRNIPIAEQLFSQHLKELEQEKTQ